MDFDEPFLEPSYKPLPVPNRGNNANPPSLPNKANDEGFNEPPKKLPPVPKVNNTNSGAPPPLPKKDTHAENQSKPLPPPQLPKKESNSNFHTPPLPPKENSGPLLPKKENSLQENRSKPSSEFLLEVHSIDTISNYERTKISSLFKSVSNSGYLTGAEAKNFFPKSSLSTQSLSLIWKLSDIDQDSKLDEDEFIIAMHLIACSLAGITLPNSLPSKLIPANKGRQSVPKHQQAPPLPSKGPVSDFPSNYPTLPPKSSDGIQGKIDNMASDAVVNVATNAKYQKAVGNAVANQAVKQENQKRFGEAVASSTDNPLLKAMATNSTMQGLAGKAVSKAATNETVQRQVGNKIAETAKDEEAKKKLGSGMKSMVTKLI